MPMPMIGVGFDDEMAALNGIIDGVGEQRSIGAKRNSGAAPQPFGEGKNVENNFIPRNF